MNVRRLLPATALAAAGLLTLNACGGGEGGGGGGDGAASGEVTQVEGAPEWCGTKEISFALLDGFGGNSWRLVTTESGRDEAAKCPSVTSFEYADGQGDTQKAISDIKAFASKGVDAMVVFPDAGAAVLPALTQAYKAGVVTVPYRVDPGGKAGENYDAWIGYDFAADARNWATWIKANIPDGGNILFLGGPAGNSQSTTEYETLRAELPESYQLVGEVPFTATDWDPTKTQSLLSAAISKNPDIDVIVSDFGPTLVSSLHLFPDSGREIPALVTTDGNSLSCFWADQQAANPFQMTTVTTGNDNVRLAVQVAIAKATGGKVPTQTTYEGPVFEDSVSGTPNPVTCKPELPGDVYLSAELPGEKQAELG